MYLYEKYINNNRVSYAKVDEKSIIDILNQACDNQESVVYFKKHLITSGMCTIKNSKSETHIINDVNKTLMIQKHTKENLEIEIKTLESKLSELRQKLTTVSDRISILENL